MARPGTGSGADTERSHGSSSGNGNVAQMPLRGCRRGREHAHDTRAGALRGGGGAQPDAASGALLSEPMLWLAVALALITVVTSVWSTWLVMRTTNNIDDYNGLLFFAASGIIGALIVARSTSPTRRVGWIMLLGSLAFSIMSVSTWYSLMAYPIPTSGFSLERLLVWPQVFTWVAGAGALFLLLPLYFPDGTLPGPRWRWVPRFIIALGIFWMLIMAVIPGDVFIQEQPADATTPMENPFGIDALRGLLPDGLRDVLLVVFPLSHLGLLIICTAGLVQRFIQARGVARQQLTWFTVVVVMMPSIILAERLLPWFPTLIASLYLPVIPAVLGITLLRGDLLTMERGSSRLVTWITLLTSLVVVYLLLAGTLGVLFGGDSVARERAALVAAGVTVICFQPLRARIELGVQRLMYGEHASRYAVLARLGHQLEQAQPLAGDSVLRTMVDTLREALNLPWAALSLHMPSSDGPGRPPAAGITSVVRQEPPLLAASGSFAPGQSRHAFPIIYQQEQVGTLHVATAQPGDLGSTERQLLNDLTRQFGIAIHNVRLLEQTALLNADLQRSRERLVLAREEERRRMRRELHDGLAPTLAALNLKAGMIRSRISRDPAAAEALLDDWRGELRATIADVRRLAYELRPPILDEIGLLAAITERAHQVMSANPGLQVRLDAPTRLPGLPAAVEVAAYRLVQEALTNVERHAQATHADVALWLDGEEGDDGDGRSGRWLWVAVLDDGRGLPPPEQRRAGVGVLAMRERAEELGGQCAIRDRAELAREQADATSPDVADATSPAHTAYDSPLPPHGVQVLASFPLPVAVTVAAASVIAAAPEQHPAHSSAAPEPEVLAADMRATLTATTTQQAAPPPHVSTPEANAPTTTTPGAPTLVSTQPQEY